MGLDLEVLDSKNNLKITVEDTGEGLSAEKIAAIINGNASSEQGTEGERGYGFGLQLIKHLISGLNGKLKIHSVLGEGSVFEVNFAIDLL